MLHCCCWMRERNRQGVQPVHIVWDSRLKSSAIKGDGQDNIELDWTRLSDHLVLCCMHFTKDCSLASFAISTAGIPSASSSRCLSVRWMGFEWLAWRNGHKTSVGLLWTCELGMLYLECGKNCCCFALTNKYVLALSVPLLKSWRTAGNPLLMMLLIAKRQVLVTKSSNISPMQPFLAIAAKQHD